MFRSPWINYFVDSWQWEIILRTTLFKFVKSIHIRHFPFFFLTMTMFASHVGYWTPLMKHVSKNLWTSTLAAEFFSSDILRSFCFFGFAEELICSLCSMMLLLTLVMSKVDQAKTSLFLSRNDSSYTSSSDERSYATNTKFSGTIGYSMTRSVLHSTSDCCFASAAGFSF
jgi:hypothetical protein